MEASSSLLALCAGNSPVNGEFPSLRQWRGALMFSLIRAWICGWVNTREAGDLRRHRAHYDVIIMTATGYFSRQPFTGYPCDLAYSQVSTIQLIWKWGICRFNLTTGTRSSIQLQWLDLKIEHGSPSNDHKGEPSFCVMKILRTLSRYHEWSSLYLFSYHWAPGQKTEILPFR